MSTAYKCNDCGTFFEGSAVVEGEKVIVQSHSPSAHYCRLCMAKRERGLPNR